MHNPSPCLLSLTGKQIDWADIGQNSQSEYIIVLTIRRISVSRHGDLSSKHRPTCLWPTMPARISNSAHLSLLFG
jgi:hypothetical protein